MFDTAAQLMIAGGAIPSDNADGSLVQTDERFYLDFLQQEGNPDMATTLETPNLEKVATVIEETAAEVVSSKAHVYIDLAAGAILLLVGAILHYRTKV